MPALQGRFEVTRLKQRLDEAFKRVDRIDPNELELRADMARYLCILVTGYVERSLQELTIQWCRVQSSPSVLRHASRVLGRLQNINGERLKQTLNDFEPDWRAKVEDDFGEEIEALDSLYRNRNQIAHGVDVALSVVQVLEYYARVERLVRFLVDSMNPAPVPAG